LLQLPVTLQQDTAALARHHNPLPPLLRSAASSAAAQPQSRPTAKATQMKSRLAIGNRQHSAGPGSGLMHAALNGRH
jgi:hypothetical protein